MEMKRRRIILTLVNASASSYNNVDKYLLFSNFGRAGCPFSSPKFPQILCKCCCSVRFSVRLHFLRLSYLNFFRFMHSYSKLSAFIIQQQYNSCFAFHSGGWCFFSVQKVKTISLEWNGLNDIQRSTTCNNKNSPNSFNRQLSDVILLSSRKLLSLALIVCSQTIPP